METNTTEWLRLRGRAHRALAMLAVTGMIVAGAGFRSAARAQTGGLTGAPIPGEQTSGQTAQPSPGEIEKERLAVNPVTGMAVLSGAQYVPLTGKERWKLYWKQNYLSMGAYFGPVVTSLLLDQVRNDPPEWGGGMRGYGRRLGSRTGSAIIQGSVQAVAASFLHDDVRYIPSEPQSGARRALHAIAYSFLTYNRQGRPMLNVANLGAYYVATAVSTTWLPRKESAGRYTLTNGTVQIALTMPVNLLQEFWPELIAKIRRHR